VQASIRSRADGTTTTFVPAHQAITVSTHVKSVSKATQQAQHCGLDLNSNPDNHYTLSGCMVTRDKPLALKFAVQSPSLYVTQTIKQIFAQNNTELQGKILLGQAFDSATVVKSHSSAPLKQLIKTMLQDSNNLYADNLTKQLGADYFQTSGSFNSGTAAIKQILLKQAEIDLGNAVLEDGSGLSRNNRLTPKVMLEVMRYVQNHDSELGLLELLPVAGINGTLKYRPSMRNAPILGQLIGKSGSLFGSYNMVGYSLDKQGKIKHTFVQFISDYHPHPSQQAVEPAITQFERAFYSSLVETEKVETEKVETK
jgi:D-alanyl-D-alanine carboxypeptidase/D-alanyl-D-alanine-endopeptidase (penicillin-binding protein 4)